jgi:hypothetical protein
MTSVNTKALLLCLLATLLCAIIPLKLHARQADGQLRVMTYNVNEGTDYIELLSAKTVPEVLIAVGQTITQVRATNPPERMPAVAAQILSANPTIVTLQEVDRWYTGTFNPVTQTCSGITLEFDMVQELLDALAAQGGHYKVAVQALEIAFPPTPGLILPSTFICVALENFNMILVRSDLPPSIFTWTNPQSAYFTNIVYLHTPIGVIPVTRSWVSVDARFKQNAFRLIGSHLEVTDATIRDLQGGELRAGPGNTPQPVIIAMDSNAQAAPLPQDPAYLHFLSAGYDDAWSGAFPDIDGFTCCQAELDNNPVSQLFQRIDLILTLGNIGAKTIDLYGANPADRTVHGLWPSDHAGVSAWLKLENENN